MRGAWGRVEENDKMSLLPTYRSTNAIYKRIMAEKRYHNSGCSWEDGSIEYNKYLGVDYLSLSNVESMSVLLAKYNLHNKITIRKYLNCGSSGLLFEIKHATYGKCAMKFVFWPSDKIHYTHKLKRFGRKPLKEREDVMLSIFGIGSVIKLYGSEYTDEFALIFMELAEFGDLGNFGKLKKVGLWNESMLYYLIEQFIEPLRKLDDFNVIHSDIKPANILATTNANGFFRFKLGDFSGSYGYTKNKEHCMFFKAKWSGTSGFMAPEVLRGDEIHPKYANRIDMFSFGVTLYYLATKHHPYDDDIFHEKDKKKQLEMIEKNRPVPIEWLSNNLSNLILWMIHPRIENRCDIKAFNFGYFSLESHVKETQEMKSGEEFNTSLLDGIFNYNCTVPGMPKMDYINELDVKPEDFVPRSFPAKIEKFVPKEDLCK